MEYALKVVKFVVANYDQIIVALCGFIGAVEAFTRMIPTSDAHGFVTRVGMKLDKVAKIANNIKKKVK